MFLNPADDILARSTVETWVIKAEKGDVDCCPKCDGKVYEAEKMVTASVSKCFIKKLCCMYLIVYCTAVDT